ncbi:MAG: hypothetical protein ABH824_02810 [Nanoarchaeota archaeon]|nr:hypothetical protein [Nanoarchaeota archaeon]MBU1632091.1 hypothetical protein [Nanoarchaeota archaeon]MBU1875725.1 hypothetical protein [Nanoarchaeota archaeon]
MIKKIIISFLILILIIGCSYDHEEKEQKVIGEIKTEITKEIKIPDSIVKNCIGSLPPIPQETELIASIGGGWVRPHPGPYIWEWIEEEKDDLNFKVTDEWAKESQKNNVAILATVWPYAKWDQEECHAQECEISNEDVFYPRGKDGIPKSRCAPCNIEDYKNFILKLVDRYDGDGIDDMPGLVIPIKYWEIMNEPDLKSPSLTFYKGTQKEYVEILKVSYETIKSTCPDCKIVQGGAAGIDSEMIAYWNKIFQLEGGNYFDIANIHYINYGDADTLNVKDFKKLMAKNGIVKPIWVTEVEFKTEDNAGESVDGAFNAGAEKLFFTGLIAGKEDKPLAKDLLQLYENTLLKCK